MRAERAREMTARGARRHILVLITLLLAKLSHSFVRETALGGYIGYTVKACPLRGLRRQYVRAPSCFPSWVAAGAAPRRGARGARDSARGGRGLAPGGSR